MRRNESLIKNTLSLLIILRLAYTVRRQIDILHPRRKGKAASPRVLDA